MSDEPKEDMFAKLPDEQVLQILAYFNMQKEAEILSKVSRRFRDLCEDASLWPHELDLILVNSMSEATALLDRCPQLKILKAYSERKAIYALEHCPKLHRLEVYGAKSNLLETIERCGHALRELTIGRCLEPGILAANAHCLRNITHLNLDKCFFVKDADIRAIVENCQKLELLSLGTIYLSNETAVCLFEKFKPYLKHLFINGHNLDNQTLKKLGECNLIKTLRVVAVTRLQRSALQAIVGLEQLCELKITKAFEIENGLSGEDLVAAFREKKFKKLTKLALYNVAEVNFQGESVFSHCPDLEVLRLNRVGVTDEDVGHIARSCPKLRRVWLNDDRDKLTPEGLWHLTLHQLDYLGLYESTNIDRSSLQDLANELRALHRKDYCQVEPASLTKELYLKSTSWKYDSEDYSY